MEVAVTPESAAVLNNDAVKLQAQSKYLEADELYKRSLAIWQSMLGPEDLLVAQSLANRSSLYRTMGEHHEAERIFQIAQRIWTKRGFPKSYDQPLWADPLEQNLMLRHFGSQVRNMRDGLAKGDLTARSEMADTILRLGPWFHNVVFGPGVLSNTSNRGYPARRCGIVE